MPDKNNTNIGEGQYAENQDKTTRLPFTTVYLPPF